MPDTRNQQVIGSSLDGSNDPAIAAAFRRIVSAHDGHVGRILTVTTAAADTEVAVPHTLGYVPQYVELLRYSGETPASNYIQIAPTGTPWTSTYIYIKCNTATATIKLRLS